MSAKPELNKKRNKVNHHLEEMCNRKKFFLFDHSGKVVGRSQQKDSSRLHLNRKRAKILEGFQLTIIMSHFML